MMINKAVLIKEGWATLELGRRADILQFLFIIHFSIMLSDIVVGAENQRLICIW